MSAKQSRRGAGSTWALDSWWLDIKLGFRMLIKYPGLALVGGVGIAAAVAIAAGGFSFIYGTFLVSDLPLEEGDRIVSIEIWDPAANEPDRWRQSIVEHQALLQALRSGDPAEAEAQVAAMNHQFYLETHELDAGNPDSESGSSASRCNLWARTSPFATSLNFNRPTSFPANPSISMVLANLLRWRPRNGNNSIQSSSLSCQAAFRMV